MVERLKEKYGADVLPWVFFSATIMVGVVGIVATVVFGVAGISAGLVVSIPAIIVGGIGTVPTGMTLESKGYI